MEEEDIEECIKRVNAVDNGVMIYMQNLSQKIENLKNVKKKYLDKLVDYKVFIGSDPTKEEKEKRFRDVEYVARDFKNVVKGLFDPDAGTKKFIDTIDRENEALTNQINGYRNTLNDIEKYVKNNPNKKDKKKAGPPREEEVKKEKPKKEEPKKEEKKEEPKKEEKKEEPKKEEKKEEPKKEEKKEEPKKEEKKEEPKKEEPKKEEKKEEPKKEKPKKKKAGPLREEDAKKEDEKRKAEDVKGEARFMSNIPLYLGSILPQEASYIINHPERKDELLIGFKTGSCALGQLKGKQLAVSQEFPLKNGKIKDILVCQGKQCNGCYLVAAEKKKSISLVYPSVDKGVLSMNEMLLTKMEDENPSLIEVGGEGKISLTEFNKKDICAYCKSYIFLWIEKNGKFELNKVNLESDIETLFELGDNRICAFLKTKNKFILMDYHTLEKTIIDISDTFKLSFRDDCTLIQLTSEYFVIDNGIKYDMFKYENGKIKFLQSFGKNASHVESYKKINNDTYILCEYFDGKRFFSKYKFAIKEGEPKFEMAGGPYMFDVAQRLQSYCFLGDTLMAVVEKGSKKIYVFEIS